MEMREREIKRERERERERKRVCGREREWSNKRYNRISIDFKKQIKEFKERF